MEKYAKILVDCGYGYDWVIGEVYQIILLKNCKDEILNPFADTHEGMKQANAIEDWVQLNHPILWCMSKDNKSTTTSSHEWRLERIKWCVEQPEVLV